MRKTNQRGFTLIELLVVIAIIGLLSTLAVVALGTARSKARDAKRIADVKSVQNALEMYFSDQNAYPTTTDPAVIVLGGAASDTLSLTNGFSGTASGTSYMGIVPRDPGMSSTETACTSLTTSGSCDYGYDGTTAGTYIIYFWLENNTGGLSTGLRTATPDGML